MKSNKINKKRGIWNFGGNVAPNFVDHIIKSVPFYQSGHEIIKKSSDYFLKNNFLEDDLVGLISMPPLLIKRPEI